MGWQEKLHGGQLYDPGEKEMEEEQLRCMEVLYEYNHTRPTQKEKRARLLKEMFAEVGEGCYIEPPFHANWAGRHIHLGDWVYANFGLTCVDDTHIYIGAHTMFGPGVVLATANHPLLPEFREKAYQYNVPIRIGRNCWFGAGAMVMPGVTIGDNAVIGAGSVVTRDIPPDCLAVGNPCRVVRKLDGHDREYYYRDRKIDWDAIRAMEEADADGSCGHLN